MQKIKKEKKPLKKNQSWWDGKDRRAKRECCELTVVLTELTKLILKQEKQGSNKAVLDAVIKTKEAIMSAISDFKAKQDAFNERLDAALSGIQTDIEDLNAQIKALQDSSGKITEEDQTTLDEIQAKGEELAKKAEDLNDLTPPAPPSA